MAQPLQIEVDFSDIEKHPLFKKDWSDKALKKIEVSLKELFIAAINKMQRGIIPTLPRGATGLLKQSYAGTEVRGRGLDVSAIFGSDSAYAPYVERGTKPHFPPPRNLLIWVRRILGITDEREAMATAYLISRAISRRGLRAQRQVGNWLDANEDKLLDAIIKGLDIVMEEAILAE